MAVNGGRAWPERLSAKPTTANFMWLAGVSPWVLYRDIVTLTQPPVCPLNPETICKGYTSQACKNTDIVQWSLSMPLCSAVTGKERRCDPFFSILVFLAKWYKNQVSNANKGYFLVLFPSQLSTGLTLEWKDRLSMPENQLKSGVIQLKQVKRQG